MTRCVANAMPFQFVDGNILKSYKTGLPKHGLYHTIPCHWLLMPSGVDAHTDTHAHARTRTQANIDVQTKHSVARTWFKICRVCIFS